MQIPNPIVDYDTLDEAEKAAGFDITAPDSIMEGDTRTVQVISGDVLQVIYETDDNKVGIRKAEVTEDISGDYTVFSEVEEVTVDGMQVTLKGDDGMVSLAIWTDGGFTYALFSELPYRWHSLFLNPVMEE